MQTKIYTFVKSFTTIQSPSFYLETEINEWLNRCQVSNTVDVGGKDDCYFKIINMTTSINKGYLLIMFLYESMQEVE